jgi:hypothetical protein
MSWGLANTAITATSLPSNTEYTKWQLPFSSVHSIMIEQSAQPMRVPEEPVWIHLFRQNPVFTSLHLRSPVHVEPPLVRVGGARPPPFTLSTITCKVVVYAPAERADTLSLFLLYAYLYSVICILSA